MRFMVMVPANAESESGKLPDEKLFAEMTKFNEDLVRSGVMLAGEGLQPTLKGARLRFDGDKVTVTDGPFTESKELIAGFWIIQAKSRNEAIEWMKRAPFGGGVTLEIRQLFEPDDLSPSDPSGALRKREHKLRQQIAGRPKRS